MMFWSNITFLDSKLKNEGELIRLQIILFSICTSFIFFLSFITFKDEVCLFKMKDTLILLFKSFLGAVALKNLEIKENALVGFFFFFLPS